MRREVFRGRDMQSVSDAAERVLGADAMIVSTRVLREDGASWVEVVAVPATDLERLRRQFQPAPLALEPGVQRERPLVLAVVGPAGAGKSTALGKLAVDPGAFGRRRVGVLTLDTYRLGATEQLEVLSTLAGFPLEVVYRAAELPAAMRRLSGCEVILVDTPGRLPRGLDPESQWISVLQEIRPDEVHLVVPASLRPDIALNLRHRYAAAGPTHLLMSRLDEVPGEEGVTDLAASLGMPARWVMDGEEISGDLHPAPERLLAALGSSTAPLGIAA
jgi:flagellar biosynthesis protein FlhF